VCTCDLAAVRPVMWPECLLAEVGSGFTPRLCCSGGIPPPARRFAGEDAATLGPVSVNPEGSMPATEAGHAAPSFARMVRLRTRFPCEGRGKDRGGAKGGDGSREGVGQRVGIAVFSPQAGRRKRRATLRRP